MTIEQESRNMIQADNRAVLMLGVGSHPMQQAASRLGDYRDGRMRLRAKDLVGLLLCHGARAWRSSQPETRIHLRVQSFAGSPALRLSYGKPAANR